MIRKNPNYDCALLNEKGISTDWLTDGEFLPTYKDTIAYASDKYADRIAFFVPLANGAHASVTAEWETDGNTMHIYSGSREAVQLATGMITEPLDDTDILALPEWTEDKYPCIWLSFYFKPYDGDELD